MKLMDVIFPIVNAGALYRPCARPDASGSVAMMHYATIIPSSPCARTTKSTVRRTTGSCESIPITPPPPGAALKENAVTSFRKFSNTVSFSR